MAYDAARGKTVLFACNDDRTWTWDGNDWASTTPSPSPSTRVNTAMVYDVGHGKVVLFGGNGAAGELNDTWTWDGLAWTQASPSTSPPRA
jgi:hypothetical protein